MEKKISRKALNRSFWLWITGHSNCGSFTLMQAVGFMGAMAPIVKDLYSKEQQSEYYPTYISFFNTEPHLGSIVVGMVASLEESRANGKTELDSEVINSVRSGLMGPLAGIGDSLLIGTFIPILLGIALGMSQGGSVVGAIFYAVVWNVSAVLLSRWLYFKSYELGGSKIVELLTGPKSLAIRQAVIMIGLIVIGCVAAKWINVSTAWQFTQGDTTFLNLQNSLNNILPNLLSLGFILLNWWLMAKKKMNPLLAMGVMAVLGFIGVAIGFFDPGLSYGS